MYNDRGKERQGISSIRSSCKKALVPGVEALPQSKRVRRSCGVNAGERDAGRRTAIV